MAFAADPEFTGWKVRVRRPGERVVTERSRFTGSAYSIARFYAHEIAPHGYVIATRASGQGVVERCRVEDQDGKAIAWVSVIDHRREG